MADDLLKIVQSLRRFRDRGKMMVRVSQVQSDTKVPYEILCSYLDALASADSDEFRQPNMRTTLRYAGWFVLDLKRLKEQEEQRELELAELWKREAVKRKEEADVLLSRIVPS